MRRARRTALMRASGHYRVVSLANGDLRVTPAWPQFPVWNEHDGGGPGYISRLMLAADIQAFLNGLPPPSSAEDEE